MLLPPVVLQSPYSLISLPAAVAHAAISTVPSSAFCSLIFHFSATSTSCSDHNSCAAPTNTSDGEVLHSSGNHICERYPEYYIPGVILE